MGKIRTIVLFLAAFVLGINSVNAVCDTTEENRLRSLATRVSASYEVVIEELAPGIVTPPDGETEETWVGHRRFMKIYIDNLTEDLYIEVRSSEDGSTKKYTYADSNNGTIVLERYDLTKIVIYTISVYSNSKDCLSGSRLYTLEQKTPKRNTIALYGNLCEGAEEYYLCYEYTDVNNSYSYEEITKMVWNYKAEKRRKQQQQEEEDRKNKSFIEFIKRNKGAVIGVTFIIVGAGVATTVVIIYKRRRVV